MINEQHCLQAHVINVLPKRCRRSEICKKDAWSDTSDGNVVVVRVHERGTGNLTHVLDSSDKMHAIVYGRMRVPAKGVTDLQKQCFGTLQPCFVQVTVVS